MSVNVVHDAIAFWRREKWGKIDTANQVNFDERAKRNRAIIKVEEQITAASSKRRKATEFF